MIVLRVYSISPIARNLFCQAILRSMPATGVTVHTMREYNHYKRLAWSIPSGRQELTIVRINPLEFDHKGVIYTIVHGTSKFYTQGYVNHQDKSYCLNYCRRDGGEEHILAYLAERMLRKL